LSEWLGLSAGEIDRFAAEGAFGRPQPATPNAGTASPQISARGR
jgi:hypothetical protein